jgi:hypothetical protein
MGSRKIEAPKALNLIWNLDALETNIDEYREAAKKIRNIYLTSYPEDASKNPNEDNVISLFDVLFDKHPS